MVYVTYESIAFKLHTKHMYYADTDLTQYQPADNYIGWVCRIQVFLRVSF